MNEEYYSDWLSDNKAWLMDEFIGQNEDQFAEFCKERFGERGD